MTIYIDLIFLENLFMNSIIIYAASIILKNEIKIAKILLSSIIGAVYACAYYIFKMEIYSNIILKMFLSFTMVYIAFNSKTVKMFIKELLIFYLTSFTFGGVTFALLYFINPNNIQFQNGTLIGIYPMKMILIGGLIGFIIIILSFKIIKNKIAVKDMTCNIVIRIHEKSIKIKAIIDTGNFLKEPITKNPVVIVEKDVLNKIVPKIILDSLEKIIDGQVDMKEEYLSKIRLIPFTALGAENGMLVGIKPDNFILYYQDKIIKIDNVIVGIYNKKLNKTNKYNALVGLDVIEKNNVIKD